LNTIKIPTPVEMAISATLKIALKKVKLPSLSAKGNQLGRFLNSYIGKYRSVDNDGFIAFKNNNQFELNIDNDNLTGEISIIKKSD
jgi:hypothetical protein